MMTCFPGLLTLTLWIGLAAPEPPLGFSPRHNIEVLKVMPNETCGSSCVILDLLGPPPDRILTIPPPPLPTFLYDDPKYNCSCDNCSLCHQFVDGRHRDFIPTHFSSAKASDAWISISIFAVAGLVLLFSLLMVIILKCKKWKIFPVPGDTCPILPGSFLSHKDSSQSSGACSPLKEAHPSSSVENTKDVKEDILKNNMKYWRRSSSQDCPVPQNFQVTDASMTPDAHIYAEPDATTTTGNQRGTGCSPYAVQACTAAKNPDLARPVAARPIPDGAYDNAGFLASEMNKVPTNHSFSRDISNGSPRHGVPSAASLLGSPRLTSSRRSAEKPLVSSSVTNLQTIRGTIRSNPLAQGNDGSPFSSRRGSLPPVQVGRPTVVQGMNGGVQKRPLPPVPVEPI